jgi:hypothetical protein
MGATVMLGLYVALTSPSRLKPPNAGLVGIFF